MFKFHFFIISLPFVLVFFSSILFLISRVIFVKKYFLNLIICLIFNFFTLLFVIYKFSIYLNDQQIFYLIFAYLLSSFILINLIQASVSSLQLAILRVVYLNPGISKKKIISKYSSSHVFAERIKRLVSGGIIYKKKSLFFLKSKKILLVLNFFLILKKIFNIKN